MRVRKYFFARVLLGKSTTKPPEKPDCIASMCMAKYAGSMVAGYAAAVKGIHQQAAG